MKIGRRWLVPLFAVAGCTPSSSGDTALERVGGEDTPETADTASGADDLPDYTDTAVEAPPLCHLYLTCDEDPVAGEITTCTFQVITGEGERQYERSAWVERDSSLYGEFDKASWRVTLLEETELVSSGDDWRYLDSGTAPDDSWTAIDFDDADWASGPSPLGYGDDQTTQVSYGDDSDDKYITTWFRHTFTTEDLGVELSLLQSLELSLRRDDGAIVYLNGEEVFRSNMPDGEVDASTTAASTTSGDEESTWYTQSVSADLLQEGDNVFAAEVHQVGGTSSDITLDLVVEAVEGEAATALADLPEGGTWLLDATWLDPSLLRNALLLGLYDDMGQGREGPGTALCDLSLNGEWQGLYTLTEWVDETGERLDLQGEPGASTFVARVGPSSEGSLDSELGEGAWRVEYPAADTHGSEAVADVESWLADLQAYLAEGSEEDASDTGGAAETLEALEDRLALDPLVDFLLLYEFAQVWKGYERALWLWRDEGAGAAFVPWELDLSLGYPCVSQDDSGNAADTGAVERSATVEGFADRPAWVSALLRHESVSEALPGRWGELRQGALHTDAVLARTEQYRETLSTLVYTDNEVWPLEEIAWDVEEGGLCEVEDYDQAYEDLRSWIVDRLEWMDAHVDELQEIEP